MRTIHQSLRDAPRDNMSPLWIVLTLLPLIGSAGRFECRGRILGAYYADAKSGCKAFHVCVRVAGGGVRDFRFFCPPGTLFHQEAQTCTDWGDDDPLACPADLYDGQFDLYKIGSGYDTKKLSSPGNRDEESEFGLQHAETGDRRLSQNSAASSGSVSDLRAAHSSDFFSGQRDRGRDDSAPREPPAAPAQTPSPRQSFRRSTTQRTTPSTTQYTTTQPPPPPHIHEVSQYDVTSKQSRKLVRKRPVYPTTATIPFVQNTPRQQQFSEQPRYNTNGRLPQNRQTLSPPANVPPQYKDEYVEVSRVTPKQNRYFSTNGSPTPFTQSTPAPNFHKKEGLVELYNYEAQSTPGFNAQKDNRPFKVRNSFNVADIPREDFSRTNPRDNIEVNSNGANGGRSTHTTSDYSNTPKIFPTSTPAHRNPNSVSYEPEKNNFVQFSSPKHNYYSPTTTSSTTTRVTTTTTRPEPPLNLNTVAYNTNIGFNLQPSNYAEGGEDDGQYRPPSGEDDGQYRPELYERELLSGAHSLNIAASGNRLPEDQKLRGKTYSPKSASQDVSKPVPQIAAKPVSQTSAPRPFRPAPTPTSPPQTRAPEPTFTTTTKPQTVNTQRTFDYYQTYTTTSRPAQIIPEQQNYTPLNNPPAHNPHPRPTTTLAPQPRATAPPTPHPTQRPTTRPPTQPQFVNPPNKKEDASYDYAYYDSDPGFSEYDHIEEFGKTKTKKA